MAEQTQGILAEAVRTSATPWTGSVGDLETVLEHVGEARVVLLGEASHGTHEFYRTRALITQRLIAERDFDAVVIEGDWPDAARANRYIRGIGDDPDADSALLEFSRFPLWMWRNLDTVELIDWLRDHNLSRKDRKEHAGFYGMDLYSLHGSMKAVIRYLDATDPAAAKEARRRYACFEHFPTEGSAYGRTAAFVGTSCEEEVLRQLLDLQQHRAALCCRAEDVDVDADQLFEAEQNARIAVRAEEYYRTMWEGGVSGWNLRDSHMVDTLDRLEQHLGQQRGRPAKLVVWAHNSHLGDARATDFASAGEHNVGQLVREHWGDESILIGFTTYTGTVTAASDWDEPAERKRVRPGLGNSYEALFHQTGLPSFLLDLRGLGEAAAGLSEPRLERAIGVVYRPETERQSHYFRASLPRQFDLVFHFDETRALEPLERTATWEAGEVPETFPTGF